MRAPGGPTTTFTWCSWTTVPALDEDRAHFVALGSDGECRVVMAREGDRWVAESVDA